MKTITIVPLALTDHWRRAAWQRTADHLARLWPVAVGSSDPVAWSKGVALADAASQALDADVYVVSDADVLVPAQALRACVQAVENGAPWAMPHVWVHRLNQCATCEVTSYRAMPWQVPESDRARVPYRGVPGGGCTVVRGDVWHACSVDPRFVGWGGEDEAWGFALTTLYGPAWRPPAGDNRLYHLWHPHAAPKQRYPARKECKALLQAYRNARGIPRIMRAVMTGSTLAPPTRHDPPVRFELIPGSRPVRSLTAGGQRVRFERGVATVEHGDAVEALDLLGGVRRV